MMMMEGRREKEEKKKREKANYKSGFLELCGILYSTGPHQLTAEAGRDSNQVLLIHSIHLIDFNSFNSFNSRVLHNTWDSGKLIHTLFPVVY